MPLDLGRIYDEHASSLFAYLFNLTRSEAETRDLLQELFLKLASRPRAFDGVRDERAWLIRLARHLFIDGYRKRAAHQRIAERATEETGQIFAPADESDEESFRRALSDALQTLPVDQREVVHLKLWEEMTFAEIAETVGVSLNTAASRYRYGIDKLREALRPLYEEVQ
jgi:RNA polymerase sigma-70 factor (ECF subfamily)